MSESWEQLVGLFERARELDGTERTDFLDGACAGDAELRAQLEGMLTRSSSGSDLLDRSYGALGHAVRAGNAPAALRFSVQPESGESVDPDEEAAFSRPRPGSVLGDFQLVRLLGQGGMAHVWEAEQLSLSRRVALKLVRPEIMTRRTLEMFEREARAGARLVHPGIVQVYAHGATEGLHWIAMELVEPASTLRDFLDGLPHEGELPLDYYPRVAGFIAEVAEAMEVAHAAGVIHRDLKPGNVLISSDDRPKVSDFGLVKLVDEASISMAGELAGTYFYMSPEQVAGKRAGIDHRADVFSLGVVMYEMLTLVRPFEGDTTQQVAQKILWEDPTDPRAIRSRVPRDLAVVCGKAMEKDPARRYGTMADFAADIRRHVNHEPIVARPPGAAERAIKWARRNPTKSAAGSVLALALALVSGLLVQNSRINDSLVEQTRQTREQAQMAEGQREVAVQLAQDVLALSASKDLEDLIARADRLWPAHPQMIARYEDWLGGARSLTEGRGADPELGIKARPSLAQHRRKLAELRALSLPEADEAKLALARLHGSYPELEALRAQRLWTARMLGFEPWPAEGEVEETLARMDLPADSFELNELAWSLVRPDAPQVGGEVHGLAIARLALDGVGEEDRAAVLDTLAWGLFRAGRLEEAISAGESAVTAEGGQDLDVSLASLRAAVGRWGAGAVDARRADLEALDEEVRALATEVGVRSFPSPEDAWWCRQLTDLVAGLEANMHPQTGLMGDTVAAPFGWGVAKRLSFAKSIVERSVSGALAREAWSEAIAGIAASPKYGGLDLPRQVGLLPIGADPRSGLWEFAHLQTGDPAVRGEDGVLVLTGQTGLVFVLIPGGKFWMGAQSWGPGAQNYDPHAELHEGPVHEVELSPHFLSKYEMTQGQWQRIMGANPSAYTPATPPSHPRTGEWLPMSSLHPVESVTWELRRVLLERLDLSFPTEAQWERAARGGTSTVWWTGDEPESLGGTVNFGDKTAKDAGAPWPQLVSTPDVEDGSILSAPAGFYPPNAFGMHEMIGNCSEWCLDGFAPYGPEPLKDPVLGGAGATHFAIRGGSSYYSFDYARSAARNLGKPFGTSPSVGLRPARDIAP